MNFEMFSEVILKEDKSDTEAEALSNLSEAFSLHFEPPLANIIFAEDTDTFHF
ncbi:hypothetical protein ACE1B6_11490 [Aerosakkonemataceae cyanobacterium BLCC-F154]|uniref:Uncharacterized protein n=1 Tax=Floridaenema fluviatile BLCC-F154 TaxID=3153640 RepID=A0ABV4YBH1_9CYAN